MTFLINHGANIIVVSTYWYRVGEIIDHIASELRCVSGFSLDEDNDLLLCRPFQPITGPE
jgi:hypothetical protein